jgi:TonB family protein
MKTLSTWTPPVAVSLLLHAALIALVTHQLSNNSTDIRQIQTITVELLGNTSTIESKPRKQDTTPDEKPIQETIKNEQVMVEIPPQEQPAETSKQTSTDNPAVISATETKPTSLNVQPFSKVTRKPALLRTIDPVYPSTEHRAGNQAHVLAAFTIDEKGNVQDVQIMKSAGIAFDNAVKDALKKSTFVPGYIDKEAVAVRVQQKFSFNLK